MVSRDLGKLAPLFAARVRAAIEECNAPENDLRAMVYEAYRSQALQAMYYKRGRTVIPPQRPVTNAPTNMQSWHGYGLAVDVVHREKFWSPPGGEQWFRDVAKIFKKHDCSWGGDWTHADPPHFQWAGARLALPRRRGGCASRRGCRRSGPSSRPSTRTAREAGPRRLQQPSPPRPQQDLPRPRRLRAPRRRPPAGSSA
jgi:peptidoglycan L-alanyl-D-glutamate endopeptidase CwlK